MMTLPSPVPTPSNIKGCQTFGLFLPLKNWHGKKRTGMVVGHNKKKWIQREVSKTFTFGAFIIPSHCVASGGFAMRLS